MGVFLLDSRSAHWLCVNLDERRGGCCRIRSRDFERHGGRRKRRKSSGESVSMSEDRSLSLRTESSEDGVKDLKLG